MTDPYELLGEFHDLFMDESWNRLRPTLVDAFSGLSSSEQVVDLGAGTGIGTRLLAAGTAARVVAIEPSVTMRAVLTARIVDDPALTEQVSIVAGSAPDSLDEVHGPVAGFICAHMLGHMSQAERASTFRRLAGLLGLQGRGIITVDREGTFEDGEVVEERKIGDYRYIVRYLLSPGVAGYTSEYTVLVGDRIMRQERFTGSWESITLHKLTAELAPVGLVAEHAAPGIAIIRHAVGGAA